MLGVLDFVQDFYASENFRGCWSQNTLAEVPKDNELINKEIRAQKQRLRKFLQDLVSDNLADQGPTLLGNQLYLLFEVALLESQIFQDDWPIKEARAMFAKLIE